MILARETVKIGEGAREFRAPMLPGQGFVRERASMTARIRCTWEPSQ